MDCSPCSTGAVAIMRACSESSCLSVTSQVEHPTPLEQSPMKTKLSAIPPLGNAWATPPRKCAKIEPGTKTRPVDCDAPLASVQRKPIKASVNRDLPTIKSLKLHLLPDQFVAAACFFDSVGQSVHAPGSGSPMLDTLLRANAIVVYRETCGFVVEESTLLVHRDLEKETWDARPQGVLPEHFAGLAEHVSGNEMLLRANTYIIVTSAFGMDTALTCATIWLRGRDAPWCIHGCGDMEEHCQRARVVVIAEAERDGYGSGRHFRRAVFEHSLQVAPLCTVHGMMSMLPYRLGPIGGFRLRHLQLGVGGIKGHINAIDFRHTCLVQQTRNYKPLVTLVNQICKGVFAQTVHMDYHAVVLQCAY